MAPSGERLQSGGRTLRPVNFVPPANRPNAGKARAVFYSLSDWRVKSMDVEIVAELGAPSIVTKCEFHLGNGAIRFDDSGGPTVVRLENVDGELETTAREVGVEQRPGSWRIVVDNLGDGARSVELIKSMVETHLRSLQSRFENARRANEEDVGRTAEQTT